MRDYLSVEDRGLKAKYLASDFIYLLRMCKLGQVQREKVVTRVVVSWKGNIALLQVFAFGDMKVISSAFDLK